MFLTVLITFEIAPSKLQYSESMATRKVYPLRAYERIRIVAGRLPHKAVGPVTWTGEIEGSVRWIMEEAVPSHRVVPMSANKAQGMGTLRGDRVLPEDEDDSSMGFDWQQSGGAGSWLQPRRSSFQLLGTSTSTRSHGSI